MIHSLYDSDLLKDEFELFGETPLRHLSFYARCL